MATGTRTTNTAAEGLRKLLGDIADMKLSDDADLPFLINLETMILQHLKQGASNALDTSGMNGAPAGLGGTPAPPPGMGGPPGVPGLMQGPSMPPGGLPPGMGIAPGAAPPGMSPGPPNMNELQRALKSSLTSHRLGVVSGKLAQDQGLNI